MPFSLRADSGSPWTGAEIALLRLQWIGSLEKLPTDPTNRYADDPQAAWLGHRLFFDRRFSINGRISCATCHQPDNNFTDGVIKGRAIGEARRNTPAISGIAYSPWFFWDGRTDSLWSQALEPLESPVEQGGNRTFYARLIYSDPVYKKSYELTFGALPDLSDRIRFPDGATPAGNIAQKKKWDLMSAKDRREVNRIFSNIGKAIAAYERKLLPGTSRFDRYVEALLNNRIEETDATMTHKEVAGLKLFIGKAMCVTCHQGPLFTNNSFHNIGITDPATLKPGYLPAIIYLFTDRPEPDYGRYRGIRRALKSEFNCLGEYSDAQEGDCVELIYAGRHHRATLGAFKVPSLRNVAQTGPYMHAGVFASLEEVLKHYNTAPPASVGRSELAPLNLSEQELEQLEAFLRTLDSPVNAETRWFKRPSS